MPGAMGIWSTIQTQDDRTFCAVAISGGGTRAAAVGTKALKTLLEISVGFEDPDGKPIKSSLANEIDLICGISGGSFAAASWCLDLKTFDQRFVEKNIQRHIAMNAIGWRGIAAACSESYSRINWAAEHYDTYVFEGKTFSNLPARPILRIHATNLSLGQRFTFDTYTFESLNSDLGSYPIAYACAASSAFPGLLSPMTIRNFEPSRDLMSDLAYQANKRNARSDLNEALIVTTAEFYNNKTNNFVHLADGGLVDNQGLQSILDEFRTGGIINSRLNFSTPPLRRLIIININAGVEPGDEISTKSAPPGILPVLKQTLVASMDILSAKRWMEIKKEAASLYQSHIDRADQASFRDLEEPFLIEISFRNIRDAHLRNAAMALPTSFHLTKDQLDLIDNVVPTLIKEDPEMIRLLQSLNTTIR